MEVTEHDLPKMLEVQPDNIPDDLKERDQWVVWKVELDDKGRPTKRPYNVQCGRMAKSTDPKTWSTFEAAIEAYERPGSGYAGVGFVFSKDDPFVGVDLDHCVDENGLRRDWLGTQRQAWPEDVPEPWQVVETLNTYAERSPSGDGVKVFCRGTLPEGRRKKGDFEAYDEKRFFTVTGHRLDGSPANVRNGDGLDGVYRAFFPSKPRSQKKPKLPPRESMAPDDSRIMEKIATSKSAGKVELLWAGNIDAYPSESEADLALAGLLVFWTQDPAQIERLMRSSGLAREKWDNHPDYLERTITKVIDSATDTYDWNRSGKRSNTSSGKTNESEQGDSSGVGADLPHATDMGNGIRLVRAHGNDLRYCFPWHKWLYWDGTRWAIDDSGEVARRAKQTAIGIYREASAIEDTEVRQAVAKWARTSEGESRLKAMISMAQSEIGIPVNPDELDADPWLLNCTNGTLNLKTGKLLPHKREMLITKLAPVAFDPTATAPVWVAFLDTIFAGDDELIGFVRRLAGYCLTGKIAEHVLPILHGSGSNGKSTFVNALLDVLGNDYSIEAPSDLLTAKRYESHPTALCDLFGKRLVSAIETAQGKRLAETLVKQLTGGDRIRARRMREDFWEFTPTHTIMLATNHRPVIVGDDHAIWRRIRLIPFDVTIADEDQDPDLPSKLHAERAGILAWCVEGCRQWQQHGLGSASVVTQATACYRSQEDIFAAWVAECCEVGDDFSDTLGNLFASYDDWAGDKTTGKRAFGTLLANRGFAPAQRTSKARRRQGIRVMKSPEEVGLGPEW